MAKNSKVMAPEIRFKGFTDAWVQRKLNDIIGVSFGGGTPSTSIEEYWNGTIPWLQSSDLIEHEISSVKLRKYITEKGIIHSAAKLIPANSIAVVTRVGVGKLSVVPFNFTTSQDFLSLSDLDIDIWYGAYALYVKMQQELHFVQGTSIKGITKDELLNKTIHSPLQTQEQTNIGSFFRTLDDIITATQRQITLLKQLKAAYLKQMFPQAGEKVPKVRFGGFSGDWDIRTIESFADVKTGGKDTQDAISNGKYDFYVRSPKIEKINSYSFDGEAVLTVGDGVGVGKVFHYVNGKFDYHQRVYKISDLIDVYGLFFYQYFATNFIKESQKYNAKTSVDSVRREMITKMLIPCPAIEEQIIIGDFFHNLDTRIQSQSEKVEKLKQLKSAYLQKMFV